MFGRLTVFSRPQPASQESSSGDVRFPTLTKVAKGRAPRGVWKWRNPMLKRASSLPGLSHLFCMVLGAAVACLWVLLVSQQCARHVNGTAISVWDVVEGVWAEGEGTPFLSGRVPPQQRTVETGGEVDPQSVQDLGATSRGQLEFTPYPRTILENIIFDISISASEIDTWCELLKLWWHPGLRGHVWLDEPVPAEKKLCGIELPELVVSAPTSLFNNTHSYPNPSALRMARIIRESFSRTREGVQWYVIGETNTIFSPQNLADVLSKYDHRQKHMLGTYSETLHQNIVHTWGMAYGGAGIAISYPLAEALAGTIDDCLRRYADTYGGDARLHGCICEMGLQVTHNPGFHQYDLVDSLLGIMEAHPVTPFLSLHHMVEVHTIFHNRTLYDSLRMLSHTMKAHPREFLQQTICYDKDKMWSISIAWGLSVQWYPLFKRPIDLEPALITFQSWRRQRDRWVFTMDTRVQSGIMAHIPSMFEIAGFGRRVEPDGTVLLETVYRRSRPVTLPDPQLPSSGLRKLLNLVPWRRALLEEGEGGAGDAGEAGAEGMDGDAEDGEWGVKEMRWDVRDVDGDVTGLGGGLRRSSAGGSRWSTRVRVKDVGVSGGEMGFGGNRWERAGGDVVESGEGEAVAESGGEGSQGVHGGGADFLEEGSSVALGGGGGERVSSGARRRLQADEDTASLQDPAVTLTPNATSYEEALDRLPYPSVRLVRVLMVPLDDHWVWYPRRQCCKSIDFLEGRTVVEIRLGPCLDGELLV